MSEKYFLEGVKVTTHEEPVTCNDCKAKKLCATYREAYKRRMEDSGIPGIQDEDE